MGRTNRILIIVVIIGVTIMSVSMKPESQARTIISKMQAAITAHKGAKYTMKGSERIKGKSTLKVAEMYTKVNVSPHMLYMKIVAGDNSGTEMLFVKGKDGDKVTVNAGKFLPNVKLSPLSSLMTKEQRHTILSAGFSIVGKIITNAITRADARGKFDEVFTYNGDVTYNGRKCYKITMFDPEYGLTTITGKKGDNVLVAAQRAMVPEYTLMELNGIKSFEDNLEGKTLKVPTAYAKTTIFYIDKENNLPIYQEMSDDKGVFERYEYNNVVVNPAWKADEFTDKFGEYGF
jgi:outer membrane lipoprotein-sorting protein